MTLNYTRAIGGVNVAFRTVISVPKPFFCAGIAHLPAWLGYLPESHPVVAMKRPICR